ncbi:hypothetical protein EON65_56745, partial [archaeon]
MNGCWNDFSPHYHSHNYRYHNQAISNTYDEVGVRLMVRSDYPQWPRIVKFKHESNREKIVMETNIRKLRLDLESTRIEDQKDSFNHYDTSRSYGTTDNESGDASVLDSPLCQLQISISMEDDEYGFYDQCDQHCSSSGLVEEDSRSTSMDQITPLTSFDSFKKALGLTPTPIPSSIHPT